LPRPVAPRRFLICSVLLLVALATPLVAFGDSTGGARIPQRPTVQSAMCVDGAPWTCRQRERMTLRGEDLGGVRAVVFLGAGGRADDRRVRPTSLEGHRVVVRVPASAASGPLRVVSQFAGSTRTRPLAVNESPAGDEPPAGVDEPSAAPTSRIFAGGRRQASFRYRVTGDLARGAAVEAFRVDDGRVVLSWPLAPGPDGTGNVRWDGTVKGNPVPVGRYAFRLAGEARASASAEAGFEESFLVYDHVFPIRGKHDLGQSPTNDFGGGRGRKGQDMFAACGTPLAATSSGRVLFAGYHSAAGNYVVIQRADGESYAYMHMRDPAVVVERARVYAGQRVGYVGDTGDARGCHLHFELWTPPGWYKGGHAVDPLPSLRQWDRWG